MYKYKIHWLIICAISFSVSFASYPFGPCPRMGGDSFLSLPRSPWEKTGRRSASIGREEDAEHRENATPQSGVARE